MIAGRFRSRALQAPAGSATRPTSDRLRETLFNVLAPRMDGAHFLDLFAGSGAVGIEALSRGAECVEFVERAQPALNTLRANLAALGIRQGAQVHAGSVSRWLKRPAAGRFDLVFLDPPYDASAEYEEVLGALADKLNEGGWGIAEHRRKDRLEERYGKLVRWRLLEQGDAALSFYAAESTADSGDGNG